MPQRPAGTADRAARIGAHGQRRHACGHAGRRAAAGAAGYAGQVPGVVRGEEGRVFVRPAHGELVHVGPADQHGVGRLQLGNDRGVVGRAEVFQHPRGTGGRLALRAKHVFDGHRQTGQQAQGLAGLAAAVDFLGLGERGGRIDPQEGPHRAVVPFDAVQAPTGEFRRGDFARGELPDQFGGGQIGHCRFSCQWFSEFRSSTARCRSGRERADRRP